MLLLRFFLHFIVFCLHCFIEMKFTHYCLVKIVQGILTYTPRLVSVDFQGTWLISNADNYLIY